MCGICGMVSLREAVKPELLEQMTQRLAHRGPDEQGIWHQGPVGLGHRRLSIIDLAHGHQPMASDDGNLHLVFNGEIYNFQAIAEELKNAGVAVKTRSDTEVLLRAYETWGAECLNKFVGMFAFAVWNERKKELFLARDRLGKKPLHYALIQGGIVFGSEIKALLLHPGVSKLLDLESLSRYFAYDYIPSPRSIFDGIRKLNPGCYGIWTTYGFRETRYWQPNFRAVHSISRDEALDRVDTLLRDAVRDRTVADVPIGVFLSGGLDSSAVVAYLAEAGTGARLQTFTIGFEEASFDERDYARMVAKHFGTDHHEETLSAQAAVDLVAKLPEILDEPMADPSVIPTYLLSRFTRQSVKVALGGDGGDEIFIGYENYLAAKARALYRRIPRLMRRTLVESWLTALPASEKNLTLSYKLQRFVKSVDFPWPVSNYVALGAASPSEQQMLFSVEAAEHLGPLSVERIFSDVFAGRQMPVREGELDALLEADLRLYLQDDILVKIDRASMACGLEVRSPFLDHRLVDYVLALPMAFRLPGIRLKWMLKELMKARLPRSIIERPKKGFGIPVTRWIKNEIGALVDELMSPDALKSDGLFNPRTVQRLVAEHRQGVRDHRKILWSLLVFHLWKNHYRPVLGVS